MARTMNGSDFGHFLAGFTGSRKKAFDKLASPRGMMAALYPHMFMDTTFMFDDFTDDAINTFRWTVDGDTGTTNFAIPAAASAVANGVITAATAADDAEGVSIYGHPVWKGDLNCGMAIRWQVDDVTDVRIEMGFTDPLTDYTLPAVDDVDTPSISNGAVTVAVFHMDTAQTLVTPAFVMDGDSTYATTKVTLLSPAAAAFTPVVNTWYTTVIQLSSNDMAKCWLYDTNTAGSPVLKSSATASAAAVEGGTLVQPWAFFGNRTTDGYTPQIDFIAAWQDR